MENKEKKNFLTGLIGAFLGALIGTLPWVLMYVYGNMIYSLLALIVAIASLKGYELFKGQIDHRLPFVIAINSVLAITLATLVFIPNLLIFKEYEVISLTNFQLLLESEEFIRGLLADYVISLLFTFLGVFGIIKNIKRQVDNGNDTIKLHEKMISDEDLSKIRSFFESHNALDKNNAISKDEVFQNLEDLETEVNYLISKGVIKVRKQKYYYVKKNENFEATRKKSLLFLAIMFVIIIAIGIFASNDNPKKDDFNTRSVSYTVPKGYQEYENDYDGWYYVPSKDLSGKSGFIDISLENGFNYENFEELKNNIRASFEEADGVVTKEEEFTNKNNYKVLKYILKFNDYDEIIYYIFNDSKFAIVDALDYHRVKSSNIEEKAQDIVTDFKWK